MGSQRELQLYKHLICIKVFRQPRKSVLATDLGKFAGPIGQHQGTAFVIEPGVDGAVGVIDPSTEEPAAGKLVVGGSIEAKGALISECSIGRTGNEQALGQRRLVLLAPDKLAAGYE